MTTVIDGTTGIDKVKDGSIVQADLGPNVAGNGPAFSAYQSTPQASSTSAAKVQFQTKQFDTASAFDNITNNRFQPTVAGHYQLNGAVASGAVAAALIATIYINGVAEKAGVFVSGPTAFLATVSALVYLNGTTDYAELWASSSVAQNWQASKTGTYFQGFLARAA